MVRVISVHHFPNQDVQTVEQSMASAIAPPKRLLLALATHCIQVRDLENKAEVLFSFPTVDEVKQIVHCLNGDYVATLEKKSSNMNRTFSWVRVYLNWDSVGTLQQSKMTSSGVSLESSECGMVQPMRARIAGRVTPTINQSEVGSLEMIEIPLKLPPTSISCCQISGNLLIQCSRTLFIYTFEVKQHDISKMPFIDFNQLQMRLTLSFEPTMLEFSENYVACANTNSFHVFKLTKSGVGDKSTKAMIQSWLNETTSDDARRKILKDDEAINYGELLRREKEITNPDDRLTINLPSIVKSNSIVHRNNQFTVVDKDMIATAKSLKSAKQLNYEIVDLVQLKLKPIMIETSGSQTAEEFKCLSIKPLYVPESKRKTHACPLHSTHRQNFVGIACAVSTQQEGYLYHFLDNDKNFDSDGCISSYSFTAPVQKLILEDYFLHALTDTGLETYTMRVGHNLCRSLENVDDINVTCPPMDDPVCLVGLRPFFNVETVLMSDSYLVLLANGDNSPTHSNDSYSSSNMSFWTVYSLQLPNPYEVFNDIHTVASVHRFSSPQTYRHLMNEAHIILRTSLSLSKWSVAQESIRRVRPRKNDTLDITNSYKMSCALLGDHFIMCSNEKDYVHCVPYYKMAGMHPCEVLKRVKSLQVISNCESKNGLPHYLKTVLLELRQRHQDMSLFCNGTRQNFVDDLLKVYEKNDYCDLAHLLLKNEILREHSVSRFVSILASESFRTRFNNAETALALAVLYVQQYNVKKATEAIETIDEKTLKELLTDNWELLIYTSNNKGREYSLSDVAAIVMSTNPDMLAHIFVSLVSNKKKKVSFPLFLKAFLDFLPARIGSNGNAANIVLQKTLEKYFETQISGCTPKELKYITTEKPIQDAIKFLVRSYLSQLQIAQIREQSSIMAKTEAACLDATVATDRYLFSELRHKYLDHMPPFQVELTSKLYELHRDGEVKETSDFDLETKEVLRKLQALLCTQAMPPAVLKEVRAFLSVNVSMNGHLSLDSILIDVDGAIGVLVEECPQCLVQFARDRFSGPKHWKELISRMQHKISAITQNPEYKRISFFYKKILRDILTHMATSMSIGNLQESLPEASAPSSATDSEDLYNFDHYLAMCRDNLHADQINQLIRKTGQELLANLNL